MRHVTVQIQVPDQKDVKQSCHWVQHCLTGMFHRFVTAVSRTEGRTLYQGSFIVKGV